MELPNKKGKTFRNSPSWVTTPCEALPSFADWVKRTGMKPYQSTIHYDVYLPVPFQFQYETCNMICTILDTSLYLQFQVY